jgi:tetratricopeptide (TPR) repeat protein
MEEEAKRILARLQEGPSPSVPAIVADATMAQGRGELAVARDLYRKALALAPDDLVARNNLAMVLADEGDWKAAAEEAGAVVAKAPSIAEYRDTLAYALRKGGKHAEAAAALQEAVRLQPGNASWKIAMAETLAESGDRAGSEKWLSEAETALEGGVRSPRTDAQSKRIRDLRARPR